MDEHDQEDVLYGLHKDIEITFEDDYHHSDEHYDGKVLQRLFQELGDLRLLPLSSIMARTLP